MTREEFFKRLPDPIRLEAEENILKQYGELDYNDIMLEEVHHEEDVLGSAFTWSSTPQKAQYWAEVSFRYFNEFK